MAVCISIIGKDNAPLYLTTADMDKELELQYRVHAALDVVEEKCQPISKATPESKELYLGMLYSTETHKIYGFVTNTKIKFVIVVDSGNIALRENEVRAMFRNLHMLYTDAVCNPFYAPGEPLASKKFDRAVQKIMGGNA
ncbi:PREDICTED: trafficking protein particle complex subunit 2-like protein isoform X2 [Bactrocera latifrons]|uniref:Trafficking protein particle complex subunit 2-like protein n=3 Tax=Endopterygota TaxID=33392 RepID=A0A0C9RSZ5_9HYME|nr:trafficking protein particle complex subunit 2-like protein isoform X1 [Bactrocera dorsalis]XP_018789747.1 PREDICTED: trafficking protein particle complex subunit 2-like protein isoform X2 [Bactrocera latifrons]XP_050327630.1 trafficking protein particle complex subunit 2-like protein [Bactrocera neohumeralis]